jgi:small conductance mechanosensitive channel
MNVMVTKLCQQTVLFAPRFVSSLLIFLAFWGAAHITQKIITRVGSKSKINIAIVHLSTSIAKITLLTFGGVTALGTMGINVSALVASLGLTGFALGFALRDALSNLLAGILILVYCTLKIDDKIAVAGFEGTVIKIDLRYTMLQTEDARVLIPNSTLFTNPIKVLRGHGGVCGQNL